MRKYRLGRRLQIAVAAVVLIIGGFLFARPHSATASTRSAQLPQNTWTRIALSEQTRCSDGSEYPIYARRGTTDDLIIEFAGGGACWDAETCTQPITLTNFSGYYFDHIWEILYTVVDGIMSADNPDNPFAGWSVVRIPYCTADLHVGNATRTYTSASGAPRTIYFNGRENVTEALDWVYANFAQPDRLLISGESAGAFGSIFWTPTIAAHYAESEIYQLADGAFLKTPRWRDIVDDVWNADTQANFGFDVGDDIVASGYLHDMETLPNVTFLHVNTVYDSVLAHFNAALNGVTDDAAHRESWSQELRAATRQIAGSGQNYQYFLTDAGLDEIARTTPHTSIAAPLFYAMEEDGVSLRDWLARIVFEGERFSVGEAFLSD